MVELPDDVNGDVLRRMVEDGQLDGLALELPGRVRESAAI